MSVDVDREAEMRRVIRRQRLQFGLRVLPLLALVALFVGFIVDEVRSQNRWREAELRPTRTQVDPPTLGLEGGGCGLELRTTVTETVDAVFILLEEKGTNDDGCGNGTQITLDDPVGDRDVIDESTGQRWRRFVDPDRPRRWVPVDEG